jgi:hypothetical protein
MAATLTPDGEVTYVSFPIAKMETTADGDVIVYGKATDGIVDSDRQIVDPEWAAKAVKDWLDTGGNVRVQHDQYRPVGRGIEVDSDGNGGQWVKSLVVEPVAKDLVKKGVLRSYSVGIMHPVIVADKHAVNGRIIGGELGEISLVDRPANKNCRFELVKAAKTGDAEWVGKLFGRPAPSPTDLARVLNKHQTEDVVEKVGPHGYSHGWIKVGPVNVGDLQRKPNGDVVHKPTGEKIGHIAAPNGTGKYAGRKITHEDGTDLGFKAKPAAALATLANHHNATHTAAPGVKPTTSESISSILEDMKTKPASPQNLEILQALQALQDDKHKAGTIDLEKKIDPNVGGGVDRDKLPAEDFAGPNRTYPIVTPGDVQDAASLVGKADNPGSVKNRIISIARRKGSAFVAQLPDAWKKELGIDKGDAVTEDETVEKAGGKQCPSCKHFNKADADTCKCGEKLGGDDEDAVDKSKKPAPDDEGDDGEDEMDNRSDGGPDEADDDGDDSDEADKAVETPKVKKGKSSCSKCSASMGKKAKFCPNCGAKAEVTKSIHRSEPTPADGVTGMSAQPVAPHREPDGTAIESFEADAHLDTVPDDQVAMKTAMKHETLGVGGELGALHDLLCPAYSHKSLTLAHPYRDLTGLDTTLWQREAMKTAAGAPMEEALAAQDRWYAATVVKNADPDVLLELHQELHKSFTDANPGPGTALTPGHVTAQQFRRPLIVSGNARPSFQYAGPNTAPVIGGQITASQFQRGFLHGGAAADSPANKGADAETRTMRVTQHRETTRSAMLLLHDHLAKSHSGLCPMSLTSEEAMEHVPTEQVEATSHDTPRQLTVDGESGNVQKAAGASPDMQVLLKSLVPDLVKSAVAEATAPLVAELTRAQDDLAEQRKLLKKARKEIEQLADEPDPRVAPWRGLAQPRSTKSLGDETSPTTLATVQDRSQLGKLQVLQERYLNSDDPRQREAALKGILQMRGID